MWPTIQNLNSTLSSFSSPSIGVVVLLGPGAPLWTSIVLSGATAGQLVEGPGASWEGSEVEARREEAEEEELAGCKCTLSEVVGTTERSEEIPKYIHAHKNIHNEKVWIRVPNQMPVFKLPICLWNLVCACMLDLHQWPGTPGGLLLINIPQSAFHLLFIFANAFLLHERNANAVKSLSATFLPSHRPAFTTPSPNTLSTGNQIWVTVN